MKLYSRNQIAYGIEGPMERNTAAERVIEAARKYEKTGSIYDMGVLRRALFDLDRGGSS